jgi:hypothetical protein
MLSIVDYRCILCPGGGVEPLPSERIGRPVGNLMKSDNGAYTVIRDNID